MFREMKFELHLSSQQSDHAPVSLYNMYATNGPELCSRIAAAATLVAEGSRTEDKLCTCMFSEPLLRYLETASAAAIYYYIRTKTLS